MDADSFFASVEQRDDPRLRGRPVAVGTGVVASCSYEARHWGVRTGMRLTEARHLCRSLLVLPGDYRRYEQAARRMQAICLEKTPLVEVAALDDLYLDVTGRLDALPLSGCLSAGSPVEGMADELRLQVRDEVGLGVSLGIGSNKLVAAVATEEAKPGRRILVPAGGERDYLGPWPARILPQVGPKVAARLDRLNVQRVAEVATVPIAVLCALFHNLGRLLHEQARGIDPRPVQPQRPPMSVSRCTSFDPPSGDLDFLGAMLDHLVERAAVWLRLHDRAAKGLTLTIRYGDYESAEGRVVLPRPTNNEQELKEAARVRFSLLYTRRLPLRLLGVGLTPLAAPESQAVLFPDPDFQRCQRLAACKDAIRQRFGFMSVVSGSSLRLSKRLEHDRDNFRLRTPCLTR